MSVVTGIFIGFIAAIVIVAVLLALRNHRTKSLPTYTDVDEFDGRRDAARAFRDGSMIQSQARGQGHNQGGSSGNFFP